MSGSTRSLCTVNDIRTEDRMENCRRLRLTLQDQHQEQNYSKPIGRAFAVVQPPSEREPLKSEPIKPADEKVEVIKVYLKAREQQQTQHQQSLRMLSEEVSQIQEVRYCLKNLREQMAAKNNTYKTESRIRLSTTGSRDQPLLIIIIIIISAIFISSNILILYSRTEPLQCVCVFCRSEELYQENALLKEKLHHLDDMLKCQQRKLRTMIEQVQNSKMVIQERDRVIRELEEKVAYLESENREMHDQMDYYLGGQRRNSYLSSDQNPQIVYSKPLRPSTQSSKSLPFIKVIEIKS
ncbi:tuftelin 1a [Alosa sapidissima]|uniref:tuftelin 1a n=1 Tax=Alosa sapidissima TaxID=34773 RepID=UPI001C09B37C|nr:tuftelin 1a [Alosa sapidissima]